MTKDNDYSVSWSELRKSNKVIMTKGFLTLWTATLVLTTIFGCGTFAIGKWSGKHPVEASVKDLERRVSSLERSHTHLERGLMEQRMDLEIIVTEIETMSFHYVQAQNVILYLNPQVDPFLAWKIAFYTVVTSDSYGTDPFLVLALMHHESSFNPEAKSNAVVTTKGRTWRGAIGVMQVMGFHASDYGMEEKDLWHLTNNIDVGVGVLEDSMFECNYDLSCALGQYHGSGPNGSYAANVQATYQDVIKKFPRREAHYDRIE